MKRNRYFAWLLTLALLLGLGSCAIPEPHQPAAPAQAASAESASPAYDGSGLRVDFLDVGQADSALIRCGGDAMLIDGGNVADSSYVVSYLKAQGVEHLRYLVASHAHEDHAGGLSGPLNTCTADHVYCSVAEAEGKFFSDFLKYTAAQKLHVEVPQVGDVWPLGDASVTVLGPVRDYGDANNSSLVLAVDYGQTSFLFTGDMEQEAEDDLVASGADLSATVLKVGHHGSGTSSSEAFLDAVMPEYAVISVGEDNSYGHPAPETLQRLEARGAQIMLTRECGNITCTSDGTSIRISADRGKFEPAPESDGTYIGNRVSQVFHRPDCPNLPKAENQISFSNRQSALDAGYRPCGNCAP